MALGADHKGVLRLIVGQGLTLAGGSDDRSSMRAKQTPSAKACQPGERLAGTGQTGVEPVRGAFRKKPAGGAVSKMEPHA